RRSADRPKAPTHLAPDELLLPPLFINRLPWSKGYFETIDHRRLQPADRLQSHCFWSVNRSQYLDELGQPRADRIEPCGSWALMSYRTLDDAISDALSVPRAP